MRNLLGLGFGGFGFHFCFLGSIEGLIKGVRGLEHQQLFAFGSLLKTYIHARTRTYLGRPDGGM